MSQINPDYFKGGNKVPDHISKLVDLTNEQLAKMGMEEKKLNIHNLIEQSQNSAVASEKANNADFEKPGSGIKSGWVI